MDKSEGFDYIASMISYHTRSIYNVGPTITHTATIPTICTMICICKCSTTTSTLVLAFRPHLLQM